MTVKRIVQTCQLIVLLNLTHTYVLFAANLDDFKSIAKKFIPDKLADQLTAMAAQNSAKYRQQMKTKDQTQSESIDYSDEENKKVSISKPVRVFTTPKKRFAIKDQVQGIDFEELVDRVRQQLEEKYKNKPKYEPNKKYLEESEEVTGEQKKQTVNSKIARVTKTTTENTQYYDDEVAVDKPQEKDEVYDETKAKPENDGTFFKEDDLTKTKDSYEDYVTPKRDKIFESDIEITTKASKEKTRASAVKQSRYKDQKLKAIAEPLAEDQEYNNYNWEEVKAQTGSILDDPVKAGNTPKQLKGTMIPTREYFKMSSPNYSAKSAIAEKYDFNEPLPEKDREPEDLKHFVNPPASINRKVKLG